MDFKQDLLDRDNYADFLKAIIDNNREYKRHETVSTNSALYEPDSINQQGAYIIGIDAPWGSGKTSFIQMFTRWLEDDAQQYWVINYSA